MLKNKFFTEKWSDNEVLGRQGAVKVTSWNAHTQQTEVSANIFWV